MTGGWLLFTRCLERDMYGKLKDGFLTEEKYIFAMNVVIILERNYLRIYQPAY